MIDRWTLLRRVTPEPHPASSGRLAELAQPYLEDAVSLYRPELAAALEAEARASAVAAILRDADLSVRRSRGLGLGFAIAHVGRYRPEDAGAALAAIVARGYDAAMSEPRGYPAAIVITGIGDHHGR